LDKKSQLKKDLEYIDATRKRRGEMASRILELPGLFGPLLEIALEEDNPIGSRACWILEFVFKASPVLLYPHLNPFVEGLHKVKPESSIRPLAKICELLTLAYYDSKNPISRPPLTEFHKEGLIEACFDWLLEAQKIAPKAYSMQSLYLLGQDFPWVHGELRAVLERHYASGSPGYQARARKLLEKLP
jgi:hypothetical protein